MTKVNLFYDESVMHSDNEEDIEWFYDVILTPGDLFLYSNIIGDEVGKSQKLRLSNGY